MVATAFQKFHLQNASTSSYKKQFLEEGKNPTDLMEDDGGGADEDQILEEWRSKR